MREAGKAASAILKKMRAIIKPGISTKDIEIFFDNSLARYPGMSAAFKGFNRYPASVCVSVNEEIIHGIPSAAKRVKEGDLVSVDVGIQYKGLFVDTAYTYSVGRITGTAHRLVKTTLAALRQGIRKARLGLRIGDISSCIQDFVEKRGFSVIRKFVGHGIGSALHRPPEVPNFGKAREGEELKEGLVIAIEPMVAVGGFDVEISADGWTAKTKDNSLSAHFEHTVAITKRGPWILTA
jgi:methionyl aminopeptidase